MRFVRVGVAAALTITTTLQAQADVLGHLFQPVDPKGPGASTQTQSQPLPDDMLAWAGTAQATSLPALLQIAVRQAPALAGARIDVEIAEARIEQTRARGDWHIAAELDASRNSGGLVFGHQLDRTNALTGTLDVFRQVPTGGTLTFHASTAFNDTSFANATDNMLFGSRSWTDQVTATFSQPLLRNRGLWYYEAQERRATLSRDAAILAKRLAAIQTVQGVVSAYWDLVLAERQVAITQSALDLAKERLRITQIGADVGKLPRSEIPAVQQIIATREEDILNSELAVLERSIALRRAAGLPIGAGELGLRVDPDLAMRDVTWDLGQLTDRAYAASPELAQLAKQDASTHIDIDVTENGLLPQLDAALSLGPTGQNESASEAAKQLAEFKAIAISGSLTFTQSLRRDDVRGRQREFRETLHKLEVNAFDLRAQIAQAMARAVAGLELARRRVALSQRAIDLANENIKIESDRFNLGKATNFDVLNRQEELRQAELRKVQAMIDWHKSETVVQALTGDILPTFGVTVE
jgi:outer membrane protein